MRYPIEKTQGSLGGVWDVWSMPIEHTIGRNSEGLEVFSSYAAGAIECARRNLQIAIDHGYADTLMPALSNTPTRCDYTYREFYTAAIERHVSGRGRG